MASSQSHLYNANPDLGIEEQANIARLLLSANELYGIWNSPQSSLSEKERALEESLQLTNRVLSSIPDHSGALGLMARIEMERCHFEKAESYIRKALAKHPGDENNALNAAYLLMAQRKYSEAEQAFTEILQTHRKSHKAFSGLALAKLRNGDYVGAMTHYQRLLELGYDTHLHRELLLDSLEFLSCDTYQPHLETLLLKALNWVQADHDKLSNLSASQIIAKFDLTNDQAILDLDQLLSDTLLVEAVAKCLLPRIETESLIVELRRAILTEISMTQTLRDELLPMAIAIGRYAARTDYILMMNAEEEQEIAALSQRIANETNGIWEEGDVVGALIVLSMYEPLYSQSFSFKLLRNDLGDWPLAIQDLLQANLYELSLEHQMQYELFGIDASQLANNDIRRASERWKDLQNVTRTTLYRALVKELGESVVPRRFKDEELNVLLVGCGSGQRAFHLAQYFENVNVYAADSSRENIAFATMKAREIGLSNIQFIHASYDHALISEHQFDLIEFGAAINHVESVQNTIEEWRLLLKTDGLIRLELATHASCEASRVINQLVKDRCLSPTADNIRHLRNAIIQESHSGLWSKLFSERQFFTGSGCRELFFNRFNHSFNLKDIDTLLRSMALSFVGFAGMEDARKEQAKSNMAPYSLLAWHIMDQDQSLFPSHYPVYCVAEH